MRVSIFSSWPKFLAYVCFLYSVALDLCTEHLLNQLNLVTFYIRFDKMANQVPDTTKELTFPYKLWGLLEDCDDGVLRYTSLVAFLGSCFRFFHVVSLQSCFC